MHPFWMLIACSLVNLTSWAQAKPVIEQMLEESGGNPIWFTTVDPEWLEEMLQPLGLQKRRATMLPKLAMVWLEHPPRDHHDVSKMPGCGKYASDSWAIFVEGLTDVEPTDLNLIWYMNNVVKKRA